MRTETPSPRWLVAFDKAFVKSGGHNGITTIQTARQNHGMPLYSEGATARAAGLAAATAYKLHALLNTAEESAGWR